MKKYINVTIIIITTYITIYFILNKQIIFKSVSFALNMWVNNLIPSLFPFFILTDILISYNFANYLPKFFINFFKNLFHIKKEAVLIFFLSMISGFPSNAKNTKKLYDMKILNKKEAEHILIFSHFSNPIFILATVSVFFFNKPNLGIIILLSHYISNLILGIIIRNNNFNIESDNTIYNNNLNFGNIFINAIKSATDSILLICGSLTSFLIIATVIINQIHFSPNIEVIIKSLLEITIGLKELSLHNINDLNLCIITSIILSFGGLCVHLQVKAQLIDTNISYKYFFIGRIYQSLISIPLSIIIYYILT